MFSKWPIQSIIHVSTWISTKMAILLDLAQRTLINITELDTNSCLKTRWHWKYSTYCTVFNPEIRELQRSIETYDMRYFSHYVPLCTSTVHNQSGDICIQGYLRILLIGNTKSSKIDKIWKWYVLCLKL